MSSVRSTEGFSENEKRLFNTIFEKFPKNNAERVRYCVENNLIFEDLLKTENVKIKKCEDRAVGARKVGNCEFRKKNYMEALKAYNESLCWAPMGSESLAIAYANRSAIFLNCHFFQFCLENIELALENNYPERLKPKLVERKEECLEKMKTEKDSAEIYNYKDLTKLSYPANQKIPFMVDGLELKNDEKYGRQIVAKQDLKIGDIVMIEDPFVKSYDYIENIYSNCFNCCMNNFLNLRPCSKTTKVMFCSQRCSEDAWKGPYQYLCLIIDGMMDSELLFNCRVAIKAFTLFDDPVKLKELIDSVKKDPITVFDVDMNEPDEITKFKIMFSLVANESTEHSVVVNKIMKTASVFLILKEFTDFKKLIQTRELEDLFLDIFIHFQWLRNCNSHAVSDRLESYQHLDKIHLAAIFLGGSLLNHSCIQNIQRVSGFGKNYLTVVRPIKAGEQLFDNYGPNVENQTLENRRSYLRENYHFICDCEACTFQTRYTLCEPSQTLMLQLPKTFGFYQMFLDPLCAYDETTILSQKAAKDELIKYFGQNKIKFGPELLSLVGMLSTCMWFGINRKPLPVMLSP